MWISIEAYNEHQQGEWERTRLQAFVTGAYGNSDAKKFPKNPQRFMPFAWDREEVRADTKYIMLEHAKKEALRKHLESQQLKRIE